MTRQIGLCGILVVALVIGLGAPTDAVAQATSVPPTGPQLTVDYSFDRPQVSKVTIGGVEYDRITMPGCASGGNAGEPALPACGARILLPAGTMVASIEIAGELVSLGDGYLVEPLSQPVRLSGGADEVVPPTPDPSIYEADALFPASAFEQIGTHGFRGYQILTLKLHPLVYRPTTGELSYYPDLAVTVNTVETGRLSPLFRGLAQDEQELLTKVDNPAQTASYPAGGGRDGRGYDLLIITTSSLAGTFQPLKDYHDVQGIATEIRTTAEIGGSDPETIRAYITDEYNDNGISYVIIGADDDVIPAKDLYVEAWQGGDVVTDMPGDIYFACLDGTWNYDGDSRWGEPNDGPGGGDVDLVAEVYVGRASGGNTTETTRFVNKTVWYLSGGHAQTEKVLLVGEYLGFGGEAEYAAGMMRQLIDGSSADGYTTVGIPSDIYVIDELFERDMSWGQGDIMNRINAGVHILNHLGHGSSDYAMKLYSSDLYNLVNTDLCFVYSQTCLAGHFDGTDCWAETMNIKTDEGGYAVIMNARYGWGTYNSTDGPSQRFNREFWDAVFGEGRMDVGRANHDSKEDNLYRINDSCMRWCYYELNLFGDPTVEFRWVASLRFEYPGGIPETVLPGEVTVIEVVVSGIGDGVPVPGSGQLHYSIDGGAYVTVDMDETSSNHYEATLPALSCGSLINFYFTAEEAVNGTFSDPRGAPDETYSAFPASGVDVVLEDDFETDQGWSVSGNATDGMWDRGIPVGGGDRGDPPSDYDGSGRCYLTDNVDGDSDVDGGYTYLDSPTLDLSDGDADVHYALWYTNNYGNDPNNDLFKTYVSNDDGADWTLAETIGPATSSGWVEHVFTVGDFVTPTSQVKVRFEASDLNDGSVVEAGIDDFSVISYSCEDPSPCPGDLDGDGDTDHSDLGILLADWGCVGSEPGDCPGDLDGDFDTDHSDLGILLADWGCGT